MTFTELREQYKIAEAAQAEAAHQVQMTESRLVLEATLVAVMLPNEPCLDELRRLLDQRDRQRKDLYLKQVACDEAFHAYISTPRMETEEVSHA